MFVVNQFFILGVVETGLFINVADVAYLGSASGEVKIIPGKQNGK